MFHQTIIPTANNHTVILPAMYYGKKVMVTVSEIDNKTENSIKAKEARAFFNSIRIDMTDFKFNREEANER